MDTDALMASVRASYTRYERNRGLTVRKRRAAAAVLFADIRAAAEQLAQAGIDAAVAQQKKIRHLEAELRGQTGIASALRDEVTQLRKDAREHLCQPLPQRTRKDPVTEARERVEREPMWQKTPPAPASAPAAAPDGSESAAKPRKPRNPVRGKGGSSQTVTEAPGGGAA